MKHSREIFPVVGYAFSSVPTYPCGTIGYVLASLNNVSRILSSVHVSVYRIMRVYVCVCVQDTVFESPVRALTESQVEEMSLKYYNTDIHRAAFALPQFVKKVWLITDKWHSCLHCYTVFDPIQVLQPAK